MPRRLRRYYGAGYLHFITTSCYHRQPWLNHARHRDLFLRILEQVRRRYQFVVVGYVVMPEHVHLLLSEPERSNPSIVIQALKQGFARQLLSRLRSRGNTRQGSFWNLAVEDGHVWQRRFYDFVVRTEHKRIEKLRYMHRNPVKRGLVLEPEQWRWSSNRHYAFFECSLRRGREMRSLGVFLGGVLVSLVMSIAFERLLLKDGLQLLAKATTISTDGPEWNQVLMQLQKARWVTVYVVSPLVGIAVGSFVGLVQRAHVVFMAFCCLVPDFVYGLWNDHTKAWAHSMSGILYFVFQHSLPFAAAVIASVIWHRVILHRALSPSQ